MNIRNKREDIEPIDIKKNNKNNKTIKRIIRKYYEQLYNNKVDNRWNGQIAWQITTNQNWHKMKLKIYIILSIKEIKEIHCQNSSHKENIKKEIAPNLHELS